MESAVTEYTNEISSGNGTPFLNLEIITDSNTLQSLKKEWDDLVERSEIDHPFLSHNWISTWWSHFGKGKTLHVITVRENDKLAAIAPLMISKVSMYGIRVNCLESLYNPHTPRFTFIVERNDKQLYKKIWHYLHTFSTDWHILKLAQMPAECLTLNYMKEFSEKNSYLAGIWHGEQSPVVPFRGTWQKYLQSLNGKHRRNIRNRIKRLNKLGKVSLEVVVEKEKIPAALTEGLLIEAAAWKKDTNTAILCRPETENFYRKYASLASETGILKLLFLNVGDARIAFAFALFSHNKIFVLKTGYNPAYSRFSPYNLLCYLLFQEGFSTGIKEYEFLGNNDPWKLEWSKLTRPHDWLFVFSNDWQSRLLYKLKFNWIPAIHRYRQ